MDGVKKLSIVVDGNDGTGKTTVVENLRDFGYKVEDRGIPTKMTDDLNVQPRDDEYYIILDAPVEVCGARLVAAGKDLCEMYHTYEDLVYYRSRFLDVARNRIGRHCLLVDVTGSLAKVLRQIIKHLISLERDGLVRFVRLNE